MAVSAFLYGTTQKNIADGTVTVDWDTDTIKVALTTNVYTPNQDTHAFFSDITNEVTGAGYTAGGVTLGSKTVAYVGASNQVQLDAADVQWTTATFTARYAIVYKSTGTASTSPVIGYVDFGADVPVSAGIFTITWDSTGVVRYDVS